MISALSESQVAKIWQDGVAGRPDLVTEEGGPIEVIYPGRQNDDRGADLHDAVIATGQGIQKGDIEIHVRSSHWWGHGHHRDPLCNRVILHVVYQRDVTAAVTLQNGRQVPTLELGKYITDISGDSDGVIPPLLRRPMPCHQALDQQAPEFIGRVLDTAGGRRFSARVAEFARHLGQEQDSEVLYQGIMEALGYTKNKAPMLALARCLPLSRLTAISPAAVPDDECLVRYQALLLGTAGLLPSQQQGRYRRDVTGGAWVERLESTWAVFGRAPVLFAGDWNLFKVRPGNAPRRRIAAMSYLLWRFRDQGLLKGLMGAFDVGPGALEEPLLVPASGFWAQNLDIGMPACRSVPALLGESRAAVIVVNVLLPFAVAWAEAMKKSGLGERAREIYGGYPALAENALENHMRRQFGISRWLVNSARRQQGLLYLYKNLCSQGQCLECPLGGWKDYK